MTVADLSIGQVSLDVKDLYTDCGPPPVVENAPAVVYYATLLGSSTLAMLASRSAAAVSSVVSYLGGRPNHNVYLVCRNHLKNIFASLIIGLFT